MNQPDPPRLEVRELDHVVLRCNDVATTLSWYRDVLGLDGVRLDEWERGDAPFPSVRVNAGTIIDLVPAGWAPTEGPVTTGGHLDHLCLTFAPFDADALVASDRFRVQEGPVPRFGARGEATSVYVLDPDDTVVELRCYPG
ncbi:MAG: VOC family protein [Acidimicrobiales bacterium]|nr:VOC family protein [Acidimicrobiales bacterium]